MRGQFLLLLPVVMSAAGASRLSAQTLGDAGAASSVSGSMSGAGQGGTLAVGSRAGRDVRRMGATPYIGGGNAGNAGYTDDPYGSERGVPQGGPGGGPHGGPPPGYSGSGGSAGYPGAGGGPAFPDPSGAGGSAGYGGEGGYGGQGAAPPAPKVPLRWGKETGEGFIDALRTRPTRARGAGRNPRGSVSRGSRMTQKQLARLPRRTRTRVIAQKYKKPPVGYLSYYLPEDRYKLTSGLWKFVTIEDDRARYPVKHYYRPDSPRFLSIVSRRARGTQARFNRVLGFASWQDALIAGYRPDPISKPSPGLELSTIASIAPRTEAARYAEFLYAGQISPDEFRRTYAYMLKVRGVINSRRDTRKFLRPTMGQILLAALGEGTVPTSVGGPPRAVVTANVGPGGYSPGGYGPGSSGGYPGSGSGSYSGSSGGYPGATYSSNGGPRY